MVALALGALVVGAVLLRPGGAFVSHDEMAGQDGCAYGRAVWLAAQSVPTGSYVPCILPDAGGADLELDIGDAGTSIALGDGTGLRWSIDFAVLCEPGDADPIEAPVPPDVTVLESLESSPDHHYTRYYLFEGGCVVSTIDAPERIDLDQAIADAEESLELIDRADIDAAVADRSGGRLRLDP